MRSSTLNSVYNGNEKIPEVKKKEKCTNVVLFNKGVQTAGEENSKFSITLPLYAALRKKLVI